MKNNPSWGTKKNTFRAAQAFSTAGSQAWDTRAPASPNHGSVLGGLVWPPKIGPRPSKTIKKMSKLQYQHERLGIELILRKRTRAELGAQYNVTGWGGYPQIEARKMWMGWYIWGYNHSESYPMFVELQSHKLGIYIYIILYIYTVTRYWYTAMVHEKIFKVSRHVFIFVVNHPRLWFILNNAHFYEAHQ